MMTRIVVVDDDMDFSEKIERTIKFLYEEINEPVLVSRHSNGSILLDELTMNRSYDIYFLDVEMPGVNGLELAQRIKCVEADADIVFVSAYTKYAVPSYKIRACYYILKEEYKTEVPVILKRIRQERLDKAKDYYIIQNTAYGKRMQMDDIMYLMREKKYVIFRCINGKEYKERGSLGEVYCKLPHDRFVYIDRGYIINLKHVSDWEGDVIRLRSGVELIASRRMSVVFKDALARYWREE
jgi:DNA-binding LytR/AlgR family response regulator